MRRLAAEHAQRTSPEDRETRLAKPVDAVFVVWPLL
jgi:hypothetical protein